MFIMVCRLLIFFKNRVFQMNIFQEYHQSVKLFGPDQVRCFVGPDLGPKCLLKGYQQMTLVG